MQRNQRQFSNAAKPASSNLSVKPVGFVWVFLGLFFLTFGPRAFGYFWADTISIVSICLVVWGVLNKRIGVLFHGHIRHVIYLIFVLLVLSIFTWVMNDFRSEFFILRNGRALLNTAAVMLLVLEVLRRDPEKGVAALMECLFWVIVAHGILVILQYSIPSIQSLVYEFSGYEREKATRVTGLTFSYNTLNLVMGVGLLLFVIQDRRRYAPRWVWAIGAALVLIAMTMAGRSALYLVLVFVPVGVLLLGRFRAFSRASIFVGVGILMIACLLALLPEETRERYRFTTLFYILQPAEEYFAGGDLLSTYSGKTADHVLSSMYFLPNDSQTFLIGNGESGRDDYYVASDVGYVLHLFGMGAVGLTVMIVIYIYAFIIALRLWSLDRVTSVLLMIFVVQSLTLNTKEQILLTRHGITVLIVFVTIGAWRLDRIQVGTSRSFFRNALGLRRGLS